MIFYLEVDINMFHCFVKDDTDLFMINILISRNSVMATIFPHFWRKVHIYINLIQAIGSKKALHGFGFRVSNISSGAYNHLAIETFLVEQ